MEGRGLTIEYLVGVAARAAESYAAEKETDVAADKRRDHLHELQQCARAVMRDMSEKREE